jgi:hypothetical protein
MINLTPTEDRESAPGEAYLAGAVYAADTLVAWCRNEHDI